MALPVGYLVYKHVGWEGSPQAKKRMLTHQLTFWGMLGVGLSLMHRAFFNKNLSAMGRMARVLGAGLLATPAFEVGERLGKMLFPYPVKSLAQPKTTSRYVPSYKPVLNTTV